MNENKNILNILTKRSYKSNKTRNMVAILAIILTTLMFTTLFVLTQSMSKNLVEMAFRQTGYKAQISFKTITDEQIAKLEKHPSVKTSGTSIILGIAENKNLAGTQVEIRYASDNYAKDTFSWPTVGTMPEQENEIALDTFTLDRLGIPHEIGQTVTIEWRKDLSLPDREDSKFILSGFWEGNASIYANMAWVSKDFALSASADLNSAAPDQICGQRMMQVSFSNDRNLERQMDAVLSELNIKDLEYNVNLAYDSSMQAVGTQENLSMYLGMVLVFIAGYLIIYNIFQISVTTDIQFYGKLKTLGTSKRQLKKIIFGQANRLCIIGIPIGIVLGFLLGVLLVPVLIGAIDAKPTVSFHPVIFLGSAIFGWLTVIISCLRPASIAGKVSPMEALRYNDVRAGRKKQKKGINGASIFSMAWSNLGRNKKRTVTVICSLTLGLVLLSCFYAKNNSFDLEKYLSSLMISDFQIMDSTSDDYINNYNPKNNTITKDLESQIEKLEGLESMGHLYSAEEMVSLSEDAAFNIKNFYENDGRLESMAFDTKWTEGYKDAMSGKSCGSIFYGADGIALDALIAPENIVSGNYDREKFETGKYLLAGVPQMDFYEGVRPSFAVGDTVLVNGESFTVMAVVNTLSPIMEGAVGYAFSLDFVMSANNFKTLYPDNSIRKLYFNVSDERNENAQALLRTYQKNVDRTMPYESRLTKMEQYKAETGSAAIMGTSVSIVIALVGVLNFLNSMVTSIVSRKKEFAMLQSVGMTKRQLRKMLTFEGIYYAAATLLLSLMISSVAIEFVVRSMVEGGYTTYHFTLFPLIVCTPIILIIAITVPTVCCKNIEKQSLVDRLGNVE